jgi:hypothetical protein
MELEMTSLRFLVRLRRILRDPRALAILGAAGALTFVAAITLPGNWPVVVGLVMFGIGNVLVAALLPPDDGQS